MGEELISLVIETVTDKSGLPEELISEELGKILSAAGIQRRDLTLDDLRSILAEYVQDTLVAAKISLSRP